MMVITGAHMMICHGSIDNIELLVLHMHVARMCDMMLSVCVNFLEGLHPPGKQKGSYKNCSLLPQI